MQNKTAIDEGINNTGVCVYVFVCVWVGRESKLPSA